MQPSPETAYLPPFTATGSPSTRVNAWPVYDLAKLGTSSESADITDKSHVESMRCKSRVTDHEESRDTGIDGSPVGRRMELEIRGSHVLMACRPWQSGS